MDLDASNTKVYIRGTDLSTVLQNTTLEQIRDEVDVTAYADAIRAMTPTLARVSLVHAGLYEDGANTFGEVSRQAHAADDEPVTVFPEGTTAGNQAFVVLAHRASITTPESASPGAVHKASLRASSRHGLGDGVVAHVGAVSGDTQTAAFQLGALAAGQVARATVHILGVTPTPAAVFYLESDDAEAFSSATVRDTSASLTARGSALLEVAGVIADTWWRVRWDHSGTGSFTVAIAITIATE